MGSAGVFSAEGHSWKVQRKLTSPAFRPNVIQDLYRDHVVLVTRRLRSKWMRLVDDGQGSATIDVRRELMSYTLDLISLIGFGYDVNSLETDDELVASLMAYMPEMKRRLESAVPYWRYWETSTEREFRKHQQKVTRVLEKIVANYRREEEAAKERSLLHSLIRAQEEEKETLSDAQLFGNCVTFLLAGNDTNANTMAWMMYFLGSKEGIMDNARAEALAMLRRSAQLAASQGKTDVDCVEGMGIPRSALDAGQLKYCVGVFNEALRMHGPGGIIFATNFKDVPLQNLVREDDHAEGGGGKPWFVSSEAVIKAETLNILLVRKMCMQEKHFSKPEEFLPERWVDSQRPPHFQHDPFGAFFHFGSGPRVCPGKSLAQIEAVSFLSMVASSFDVSTPREHIDSVGELMEFTIRPTPFVVRISRRSQ